MPVTAGVKRDADGAAVFALFDMPAERSGATRFDGGHDAALGVGQPVALFGAKIGSVATKNVRRLKRRAHARPSLGRRDLANDTVERAGRAGDQVGGHLRVARRRGQMAVAQ